MAREWEECPYCFGYKAGKTLPFEDDYCSMCMGRGEIEVDDDWGDARRGGSRGLSFAGRIPPKMG